MASGTTRRSFWVSALVLLPLYNLVVDLLFMHPDNDSGDLRVQIVTALLAVIAVAGTYRLGTSFSSQRKTGLQAGGAEDARRNRAEA